MSGRTEKMRKLEAERSRLAKQIEELQLELRGLDRAIAIMKGEIEPTEERAASKSRSRNVKETVLSLVQNAGEKGLTVNGVMDAARDMGIHLERGSVSSLLSRMKREHVLGMADGRYFVPSPKAQGVHSITH
jgi:hypothetical protein